MKKKTRRRGKENSKCVFNQITYLYGINTYIFFVLQIHKFNSSFVINIFSKHILFVNQILVYVLFQL